MDDQELDGVVLVIGKTLDSARELVDGRPELSAARITSPSSRGHDGMRVRQVYLEHGLLDQSAAQMAYVRRTLQTYHRSMIKLGADPVFYLLPKAGIAPAEVVGFADLGERLTSDYAPRDSDEVTRRDVEGTG